MNRDLLVIGTGPAASRVARKCADAGWSVAVAEKREYGGTCALRGCNPKKVFVRAAELLDWARRANGKLIHCEDARINWPDLAGFKREFTQAIPEKSEQSFQALGIATLHGTARFLDHQVVQVGETTVEARHILIATGAKPAPLEFKGHEHVAFSSDFMNLEQLPSRILFLGGGYISFEFAHVAVRAGAQVTIVEQSDRMLRQFSSKLVDRLAAYSDSLGINQITNASVKSIHKNGDGSFELTIDEDGVSRQLTADLVVHGAGRVPDLNGLDLPAGSVESSSSGVLVDEFMRSRSNPAVFAAGDCVSSDQPPLTPVANQQARAIAQTLLTGTPHTPDYGIVPSAVFTVPALAAVGLTRQQATQQGKDFDVQHGNMTDWSSVKKVVGPCAEYEILIEKQSGQILGAHLLGPGAAETINLFALAMKFELSASSLKSVLMTFPTFASDIREML